MGAIEVAAHFISQSLATKEPAFAGYTNTLSQELMKLASDATSPSEGVERLVGVLDAIEWEVWLVPVTKVYGHN